MKKKKIFIIFGTRPEFIKLYPVFSTFQEYSEEFDVVNIATGQHDEMVNILMNLFHVAPRYNLDIMEYNQKLTDIISRLAISLPPVIESENPDLVFVQGDTTSAFISAVISFYYRIPVAHVEAGLRSNDIFNPFPEEVNRKLISHAATLHFAPTELSKNNLLLENVNEDNIFVSGNTVIDSIFTLLKKIQHYPVNKKLQDLINAGNGKKIVVITLHRRENFGEPLRIILEALKELSQDLKNHTFIFPVHPNPNVREVVHKTLSQCSNIILTEPLPYPEFLYVLKHSSIVLTDSGGIQEEVSCLGIPTLVYRKVTERPEGLFTQNIKLVEYDKDTIKNEIFDLVHNKDSYMKMRNTLSPYGDGKAAKRIVDYTRYFFKFRKTKPDTFIYERP